MVLAFSLDAARDGIKKDSRAAMIEMTTISSVNVNPFFGIGYGYNAFAEKCQEKNGRLMPFGEPAHLGGGL